MNIKERSLLSEDESEIYCNLNRLMTEGVVVFVKVKLSEFLTPTAEYGTEL
ncbi:excisionase, partial [Arsenophonus sp. ENCA]